MMPRRLYGLGVETDLAPAAMAGLPRATRTDVRFFLRSLPGWYREVPERRWVPYRPAPAAESVVAASRLDDGSHYRLRYPDGTLFVIDAGVRMLWGEAPARATLDDTATYLLGPVMGFVLRLHGTPSLHASAVAVDGRAVVLAGHSGRGKSAAAAAFARLGHPVLGDDVAAVTQRRGTLHVQPAYPRVRLWPEAVEGMFGSAEALPLLTPTWSKRFLALGGRAAPFHRAALPLGAVYVLDEREPGLRAPRFEALAPREALVALVGHACVAYLLDRAMRSREFELFSRIAGETSVVRVTPPADLGRIESLCGAIAADARSRRAAAAGRRPARDAARGHAPL
jgi:hypothetical protein